jgi:hypothetical protein
VKTDGNGKYSATWKPLYGAYKIKATWAGNSTYPETSISINLNVKRFGDLITEFTSNSTITALNYNSTTRVLSFSTEGPSGTAGFVKIALEKDTEFNPNDIIVLLDERPIEYTIDSTDQSWILGITYTHSIHNVTIYFNEGRVPEVPLLIFAAILVVLITFLVILSTRTEKTKP